jgi:CheY-like chemotaxis protein
MPPAANIDLLPAIVAVDDTEDDLFILKRLLDKAGVRNPLHVFVSADEAVAYLQRSLEPRGGVARPLACFLDVKMPGGSGFDVLKWIRGEPRLDGFPVFMLSTSDDTRDVRKAAKLGASCYLVKHPSEAVMRDLVELAGKAYLEDDHSVGSVFFGGTFNLLMSK